MVAPLGPSQLWTERTGAGEGDSGAAAGPSPCPAPGWKERLEAPVEGCPGAWAWGAGKGGQTRTPARPVDTTILLQVLEMNRPFGEKGRHIKGKNTGRPSGGRGENPGFVQTRVALEETRGGGGGCCGQSWDGAPRLGKRLREQESPDCAAPGHGGQGAPHSHPQDRQMAEAWI